MESFENFSWAREFEFDYIKDADILELFFIRAPGTDAIEITEDITLRFDRNKRQVVSLILNNYSFLLQNTAHSRAGDYGEMDEIERYRQVIRDIIQDYSQYRPSRGDVQIEVIFDEANDHYELMYAGWNGPYRIHGSILHIDIRNDKIWIQYDGTEGGIAEEFVAAGIPKDKIVLAFKPPAIRPHTDFGVA